MAKANSILSIQGTFEKITHVNSRAYGKHIRAARGTHKPAVVNATMQEEGRKLSAANVPAKLFKDAIDPYRHDFAKGMMWQRLVSVFKQQLKLTGQYSFEQLDQFEIYKEYPLTRFTNMNATMDMVVQKKQKEATLSLHYAAPVFKKNRKATHYRLQVIALFVLAGKIIAESQVSPIIEAAPGPHEYRATFMVPKKASQVIWCVKFEICENGAPVPGAPSKAMKVVGVSMVE